ncbi:MAG: prenyltransferase/squalene oxidase repeat-containing protein, partial [Planctomycetota bacterium]
ASNVRPASTRDVSLPAPPGRPQPPAPQAEETGEPSLEPRQFQAAAAADEPAAIGAAGIVDPAGEERVAVAPQSSRLADASESLVDLPAHDADAPQSSHPEHVRVAARVGEVALALDLPAAQGPVQVDVGSEDGVEVEAARRDTDRSAAQALVTPSAPRVGRVDLGPTPIGAAAPPMLLAAGPADSTPRSVRPEGGRQKEGLVVAPLDQVALPPLEAGGTATGFDSPGTLALATRKVSRASWRAGPPGRGRPKAGKQVELPPQQAPLEIAINPPDRVPGDLLRDQRAKRHEPAPAVVLASREFSPAAADLKLRVPTQTTYAPNPYPHRSEHRRNEIIKRMGGSEKTERAVALALDWLQRHQSEDGRWDGTRYDSECGSCWGTQRVKSNIAVSGLALLCFLAADHTHVKAGPYKDTVDRALTWLLDQQRDNGSLMGPESLYSHGIATIALAEAYGMTGDPRLAEPVKSAVDFIYAARNQGLGGWRYSPGQFGDTSVLGWQVMALTSAKRAKVEVPEEAFEVARKWLDMVSRSSPPGLYPYQPFREVTPAMTAEGMLVQQLLGADRTEVRMESSAEYILAHPPRWKPDGNTYYWYYATLALFQHQGTAWEQWNEAVKEQLVSHQKTSGKAAGSWDPDDRWALVGGRIYQTAMCTLTLEVYYRYLPSFVSDE